MDTKGARALLDDAHVSIAEEIKTEEATLGKNLSQMQNRYRRNKAIKEPSESRST